MPTKDRDRHCFSEDLPELKYDLSSRHQGCYSRTEPSLGRISRLDITAMRKLFSLSGKHCKDALSKNSDDSAKSGKPASVKSRRCEPPARQTTFVPSIEYIPNHNLLLHKIFPSNSPPLIIKRRIDRVNARREYARQKYEHSPGVELFWVPARPARSSAADLPLIAPNEIPIFRSATATHERNETANVTKTEAKPKSTSRKLRKRHTQGMPTAQCPGPDEFRRRVSAKRTYVRHAQQYSQRQHSTRNHSSPTSKEHASNVGSIATPTSAITRCTGPSQDVVKNDDSFYWDERMPIEQAEYVQKYVQQAVIDKLVNEVVDAMPHSETRLR